MCRWSYMDDYKEIKVSPTQTVYLLVPTIAIGCCIIIGLLALSLFFSLSIYYTARIQTKTTYHIVDTISYNNSTDEYQATVQCLGNVLQNITQHCGDYDTLIACSTFPSKKHYTEIQFKCADQEFVAFLKANTGGKQTHRKYEETQFLSSVFIGLFTAVGGCTVLLWFMMACYVCCWACIVEEDNNNNNKI